MKPPAQITPPSYRVTGSSPRFFGLRRGVQTYRAPRPNGHMMDVDMDSAGLYSMLGCVMGVLCTAGVI
eukprot:3060554-Pyramimonas_sp.AAC.3